jgi:hypothetical protein
MRAIVISVNLYATVKCGGAHIFWWIVCRSHKLFNQTYKTEQEQWMAGGVSGPARNSANC